MHPQIAGHGYPIGLKDLISLFTTGEACGSYHDEDVHAGSLYKSAQLHGYMSKHSQPIQGVVP